MRKFILYRHTYVTMSPLGIQYEYIYIHKYTHKYTHTQINIYIYINIHIHKHLWTYTHIFTHSQRLKYRHTHANIEHTLIHLHLCACLSTHTHRNIDWYRAIYTDTQININQLSSYLSYRNCFQLQLSAEQILFIFNLTIADSIDFTLHLL